MTENSAIVTIHREDSFVAKLPEHAVIELCPEHLRLSPLEAILLSGPLKRAGFTGKNEERPNER